MSRWRGITTVALLIGCVVVGATGGVVLASHGSGGTGGRSDPPPPEFRNPTPISVGDDSACAITADTDVDCWGVNPDGVLGVGVAMATGCKGYCTPTAQPVKGLTGVGSIAAGNEFDCALLDGGKVECWGANNYGQLGVGDATGPQQCQVVGATLPCSQRPMPVIGIHDAVSIAAGAADACAVVKTGQVDCWGSAVDGVLGDESAAGTQTCGSGDGAAPCSPAPVPVFGIGDASMVAVGSLDACALVQGGRVMCWGDNGDGQLGDDTTTGPGSCEGTTASEACSLIPVLVHGIQGATSIAVGAADSCALLAGGKVDCWGDNSEGALGTGSASAAGSCPPQTTACAATPQPVDLAGGAIAISAGNEDACATLSRGRVDCWGAAAGGALGIGDSLTTHNCVGNEQRADQLCATVPTPVPGLDGVNAISAGIGTTCALMAGGGADCWGQNQAGQLGIGRNTGPENCSLDSGEMPCSRKPQSVQGLA